MRSTVVVRLVIAVAALAVAVSLLGIERDRDSCDDAVRQAYLGTKAPEPGLLDARIDSVIADCKGSEPLTGIAVGLRVERPRAAARLARAAAEREPDSYVAWGVLAVAAPPAEAAVAARRARALNPLSVAAGP